MLTTTMFLTVPESESVEFVYVLFRKLNSSQGKDL